MKTYKLGTKHQILFWFFSVHKCSRSCTSVVVKSWSTLLVSSLFRCHKEACKICFSSPRTLPFHISRDPSRLKIHYRVNKPWNRRTSPKLKNMESIKELKKIGSFVPKFYFSLKICILLLLGLSAFIYLLNVFLEFRTGTSEVGQRPKINGWKNSKTGGSKIWSRRTEPGFGPKISLFLSLSSYYWSIFLVVSLKL